MIGLKMTPEQLPDWFIELIDLRVTSGLDDAQQERFDQFVAQHPHPDEVRQVVEQYELTAAALDLQFFRRSSAAPPAEFDQTEPLPDRLRSRLLSDAETFFTSDQGPSAAETHSPKSQTKLASPGGGPTVDRKQSPGQGITAREAIGWLVAAASIAILLTGWNPFSADVLQSGKTASLSIEEQLDAFVSSPPSDLTRVDWKPTAAESNAGGEVVWSDDQQTGYMVFENFAANDPAVSQYQLWIFDTVTTQTYPVDGGVFDIDDSGKATIKIDAKILVDKAVMFAITEEEPGGVVVSDRKRLPLLAVVE